MWLKAVSYTHLDVYKRQQPHIDLERAKSMTKTYEKYEGVLSIPELRGQVLKDYFATKTLYIGEGELIVGEKGDSRCV